MAFGGDMGRGHRHRPLLLHGHGPQWQHERGLTVVSGDFAGYSPQAVSLHLHVFRSTSLHSTQTVLFFPISLPHTCTSQWLGLWAGSLGR